MRKFLSFSLLLVLLSFTAAAQRTVTGTVTDEKNGPLADVTVTVKGTQVATKTNDLGQFTLSVPAGGRILVFTSVAANSRELTLGNQSVFNVSLNTAEKRLSEVVVVGYGVQQRRAFTGSVSKIDVKDFSQLVTPSIDKQLAGRAAGVNVVNSGGLVNTPARIRIRGINSLSLSNDPLIVVDGVPIIYGNVPLASQNPSNLSNFQSGNLASATNSNALADINPSDIESIEVLKDGSSTAIYGSRAANGVILITTKKGTRGRALATYETTFGTTTVPKRFDLLNAQQFTTIANEMYANAGQFPLAKMDSVNTNTDWQDFVYVNNAPVQTHTVSLQNNTGKFAYYFSLNYSDQKGVIRTNSNRAYRARLNLDHEVNKFLKIGNYLTLSRQDDNDQNNGVNSLSGAVAAALRALPNVAVYDPKHPTGYNLTADSAALGAGANLRSIENNYVNIAYVLDKNRQTSEKYRLLDVAYLEVSPVTGLRLRSQFSADIFTDYSLLSYDPNHGDGRGPKGLVQNVHQNIFQSNMQNTVSYNGRFGHHGVIVVAGHELQQTRARTFFGQGENISDAFFLRDGVISNTAAIQKSGGDIGNAAFESLLARVNYDFKNRYFLQGSIRRDGLSSLSTENRYGVFPGFSAGWRLSDENFWRNNRFLGRVVSEFKLRASYATVGNNLTGFRYLSNYGAAPYGSIGGLAASNQGNRDLRWEKSNKFDVGVDMNLWRDRVNVTFDWFRNDINDLILAVPTPMSAGVPNNNILQNIGKARNVGIELSVTADVVRSGDFTWNVNTNFSQITNEVLSLYTIGKNAVLEIPNGNYNLYKVGQPLNVLFGYRFAGVNSGNGNPVYYNAANQLVQRQVTNGTYYFANSLSDPTLGAQTSLTNADKALLGNVIPRWFGAVTNTFGYKGFAAEVMLRYSGGNKIMNITRQESLLNLFFQNQGAEILNRWTTPGQVTDVPRLIYGGGSIANQNGETISRFVEDGDFLRLQNVVLSYNFNSNAVSNWTKGYIKSARVFVQGQNLAVWTRYKGIDPEAFSGLGQDNAITPPVRILSAGLNISF